MGDQLMSGPGTVRAPQLSITDPKVCRSYLVGTCPHDLFTNTKQDLGICPRTHNEALKAEYDSADDKQKQEWGFDFDYLRDMQKYIDDCNRRIDVAQRRLEQTHPEEIRKTNDLVCRLAGRYMTNANSIHSSKRLATSRGRSRMACSRFQYSVSLEVSTSLSQSTSRLDRPKRSRRMLSASSRPCQTLPVRQVTRSSKCAMSAAHISVDWTTTVD